MRSMFDAGFLHCKTAFIRQNGRPAMVIAVLFLLLPRLAAAVWQLCDAAAGNYTANGTYHANLELLSANLSASVASSPDLFAKVGAGTGVGPDRVFGLALCRGDVTAAFCLDCVGTAFYNAQAMCPYSRSAFILDDACLLRFAAEDFLASTANLDQINMKNDYNVTDPAFPRMVRALLNGTARWAAENSTVKGFATARLDVGGAVPRLYALTQCTPDLSAGDCWRCLEDLIVNKTNATSPGPAQGARIVGVRCGYRYEVYPFYSGEPMLVGSPAGPLLPTTQLQPPVRLHSGKRSKTWIIALVLPLLSMPFCLMFCFGWIRRLRKRKLSLEEQPMENFIREEALEHWRIKGNKSELTLFVLSELSKATGNFAEENMLGQGGFGPVYKGQLPNGLEIAVKRLASRSGQGLVEFKNEIQLIAKLQHSNLVSLLGCCIQGEENILVYEYMPNKSLDFFIFDTTRAALLTWVTRLHIIEGIAQGLLYLHRHSRLRVIHRDLKASNILLDNDMNPKISDFGLAKIFSSKDIQGNTNRVVGTYGYMSPEYASKGVFSIKSDVYSFGVLLLEIVCGKRNAGSHQYGDFFNLLCYAWQLWKEERWIELVDPSLAYESQLMEMKKCIKIGLLCVQENAADRPNMSDVVMMLSCEISGLPEPKQPAYFNLRLADGDPSSSTPSTANDVTITVVKGR